MKEKIKALFSSLKFWIVTLTFVTFVLESIVEGNYNAIFDSVQVYLATVATIGALDGIAERVGARK